MRLLSRVTLLVALALIWNAPSFAVDPDDQPWDEIDRILKEEPQSITTETEAVAKSAASDADFPGGPDRDPEPGIENDRPAVQRAADPGSDRLAPLDPNQGTIAAPVAPAAPNTAQKAIAPETPAAAAAQTAPETVAAPAVAAPAVAPAAPQASSTATAQQPTAADQLYLPVRQYAETTGRATLAAFDEADRAALAQFYDARMGQAQWVTRSGLTPAGSALIDELKKAADWGLSAKDFAFAQEPFSDDTPLSDDKLAERELKLALTAMLYARQARGGRISNPTEQLSSYLDRKPQLIEPAKVIEALATAPDKAVYLRSLHPKNPQFEKLRQKLIQLRTRPEPAAFEKLPASGPKISAGKSNPQIALIRERLKVAAPEKKPDGTPADAQFYDPELAQAVIQFKQKHEIEPATATITNELRRRLNQDDRLSEDLLLANMEQWRWMPDDLGSTHIEVNVPEFMVRVIKDNAVLHSERVVTGRFETQTPIFSDRLRTVVLNPSWIVPHSIMINELLPKLRAGGNPIARQGLEIKRNGRQISATEVNWNRSDIRNYHIYQPPGPSNVLGVVKFLFPNKHAVYLHDTPSKSLFNENVRTFSHGCVRVRNPVQLAEVILDQDKGWDARKVKSLIADGPGDNDVTLDAPMPVHIMYFTAWVEDDGNVKTFQDVYGHEKRITLGLAGRWTEIVKNRDHMLPPDANNVPVARAREDWGDTDGWSERRDRAPRVTYQVPPPGYKKNKQSVGDLLQQVFGGF